MKSEKEIKKSTIIIALTIIILIQLLVRFYVGVRKEYFHIDEAYSYSLMNYDKIQITENEDFYDTWHTKDYYKDYLSVNEDEKWDWKPVYENQKNDVHPPLYYLLLRIFASFTINEFTKWTGIILNMLIFVFSSIFIYLIGTKIFKNKKMALFSCLIVGLTLGALETTIYIRMYELANLFVLILTYLHIKLYNKDELEIKDLFAIGITALLSSLTHYYLIIYMAVLFIMFVVKYISKKQYKNLIKYASCFVIAAVLSIIIFPASLYHMFGGYRGQGAVSNLSNMDTFFQDIGQYLNIFNKQVINNLAVIFIIIYIIFNQKRKRETNKIVETDDKELDLILIPTLIYFILVAKMSPYKESRYIMPIISVSILYIIYIFNKLFKQTLSEKVSKIATVSLFTIMIVSPIFTGAHLDFTYKKMNHLADKMEEMADIPTLYIFNENEIRFLDDIYIFTKIENSYIMRYSKTDIENIKNVMKDKDTSKGMIVVYNNGVEPDKIVEQIKENYDYTEKEEIQRLNCGNVLYLH